MDTTITIIIANGIITPTPAIVTQVADGITPIISAYILTEMVVDGVTVADGAADLPVLVVDGVAPQDFLVGAMAAILASLAGAMVVVTPVSPAAATAVVMIAVRASMNFMPATAPAVVTGIVTTIPVEELISIARSNNIIRAFSTPVFLCP